MNRLPDMFTTPSVAPSSRSNTHVPRPGWRAQEVRGPQDEALLVEVGPDLAVAVGVVAERDHVDAGGEQLVGVLGRDADAARGVLAVGDDEVERELLAQARAAARASARRPGGGDDVADEEDGRHALHGTRGRAGPASRGRILRACAPPNRTPKKRLRSTTRPRPRRSRRRRSRCPPPRPEPPAHVAPVVVPRWIQLVVLPLALLGVWALARAAGPVLLLFMISGLIALLLNPFVTLLRRARFPRGAAVGTVFLVLVLALAGAGLLLSEPISNQISSFRDQVPEIVDDANDDARRPAGVARRQRRRRPGLRAGPDRGRSRSATTSRRARASWWPSRATRSSGSSRRRSR